jgi:hypothetical protein
VGDYCESKVVGDKVGDFGESKVVGVKVGIVVRVRVTPTTLLSP